VNGFAAAGGGPDWQQQGGPPGETGTAAKAQNQCSNVQCSMKEEPEVSTSTVQAAWATGPDSRAAARAALEPVLEDVAARLAHAELAALSRRADKAADDRAAWNAWVVEFYRDTHYLYALKCVQPLVAAWNRATGEAISAADVARSAADPPVNLITDGVDVPSLLSLWPDAEPLTVRVNLREALGWN
jgi:hypothetical protein